MSTEGSKYVNKEIKNALKEVKQIKTLIEQSNEERKSLLSSLEEAKKKKEVRKSQVPPPPAALTLCAGGRDWLSLLWMACQVVSQVAMATHSPSRQCQLILRLWLTNREGLFAFESFKG